MCIENKEVKITSSLSIIEKRQIFFEENAQKFSLDMKVIPSETR